MSRLDKRRRLLLRWTILSGLAVVATIAWALTNRPVDDQAVVPGANVEGITSVLTREAPADVVPFRFRNVTEEVGVRFVHFPAARASQLPEDMGSGVACGDYDGDGFTDLFFVNFSGSIVPGASPGSSPGRSVLYRNVDGRSFVDVTAEAGIEHIGWGLGAAWGDYDNDGDLDLYITGYGENVLYENLGDGTFRDVTIASGTQDSRFSTGCSWGDFNRDGHIDLYVCNYVDFVYKAGMTGVAKRQYDTEQPYTLNPSAYAPLANALFLNRGDGTFENVAEAAGVADPNGRSLSASWADLNNDGWVDLYVANDVSNNGVFLNNRDGTFRDVGAGSLAADYRGAMGIAVADLDDDLDLDLLITHWIAQENALYRNMTLDDLLGPAEGGRLWFMDESAEYGFGQNSLDTVGWATGFCDFANNGLRDLWIVNGSTLEIAEDHSRLEPQRAFLLWNRGPDGFVDVAERACPALAEPMVGRGGARFDYNRDGLMDLVMVRHGDTPLVLKNVTQQTGDWLGVRLRQEGGNTRALGGRVYVTSGGRTRMEEIGSNASYLSQDEEVVHFGLGDSSTIDAIRIVWPDGAEEVHRGVAPNQVLEFVHRAVYPVRTNERPDAPRE